ncbi:hypothetical protein [Fibrella aquatilis]|uniref:Uncharacterized protein n=1 Tax=Fibrella aquatilis TaxID=2817059 RepID=A0A939G7U9_9BACT|nr:hypothetical protein [Fibrella aquatilis]MBO0933814.1 hypothetical protein [Fibrella aquatilis]
MEHVDKSTNNADISTLRKGIKRRYAQYHAANRDKYPKFDFNSNRINYQPLKDSFEEEFFERRQIDRINNHLHIPSLNTLVQLFTNDEYLPSRKIVNTCRSYALFENPPLATSEVVRVANSSGSRRQFPALIVGITGLVALGFVWGRHWFTGNKASGLVIQDPPTGKIVPRLLHVAGRVSNADTVWVVIHPGKVDEPYYLQDPIPVKADGTWEGHVLVGALDHRSDGVRFDIRAFVRISGLYKTQWEEGRYEYDSWPEKAECATEPITVVRGNQQ